MHSATLGIACSRFGVMGLPHASHSPHVPSSSLAQRTLRALQADLQRRADPDLGQSADRLDGAIPDPLAEALRRPALGALWRGSRCARGSRRGAPRGRAGSHQGRPRSGHLRAHRSTRPGQAAPECLDHRVARGDRGRERAPTARDGSSHAWRRERGKALPVAGVSGIAPRHLAEPADNRALASSPAGVASQGVWRGPIHARQ